jgi:N-acetylglutamate synthase
VQVPSTALGPHVVGSRIVVRRLVPGRKGPTGGPAFTDVLGVCTSWADGLCVVQPASGAPVEVPIELIVSGKPVPPRPSVRLRVTARQAESHAGPIWPGVERIGLGEWELRTDRDYDPAAAGDGARRLIKRANSCLALGDPGLDLSLAAQRVQGFYAERGRPALAQVELDSPTEAALRALGWTPIEGADAHLALASVSRALRLAGVRRQPAAPLSVAVDGPRVVITAGPAGEVWGTGEAALDGDWLGIHQLAVSPDHRRRGVAWTLMAALLEWGAEQGARTAWLHVETENTGAFDLYERLGFSQHHTLRYLGAPDLSA